MLLSDKKILIVDDSIDNLRFAEFALARVGAEVRTVASGHEAVQMVAGANPGFMPSLILMDICIPDLDGYKTTRVIRNAGYRSGIVAYTAESGGGERESCLAAGCDAYITKPITPEGLVLSIARLLGVAQV